MNVRGLKLNPAVEYILAAGLAVLALALVVIVFEYLPIEGTSLAIDWKDLWRGVRQGQLHYDTNMFNPPWAVLPILPLGLLSIRASWGVLTFFTLAVLVVSVPASENRGRRLLAIVLLCASFPALRHFADGNFEGLVIAGVLLSLYGFAKRKVWALSLGVLFATVKFQETWLLILVLAYYLVRQWPARQWLLAGLIVGGVVGLTLIWKGREWWQAASSIPYQGHIINMSLLATAGRLGLPGWLTFGLGAVVAGISLGLLLTTPLTLSREKAGLLIAAAMLLGPYAAGNSMLTVLAVGIIPIFLTRPSLGLGLLALINLPFLFSKNVMFHFSASYWTAVLILVVGVCAGVVWQTERAPRV